MGEKDASARLFLDARMEAPELLAIGDGQAAVFACRAPDSTSANQDSIAVVRAASGAVLIVADGAGGLPSGAKASAIAVEKVAAAVANGTDAETLRSGIMNGFEEANAAILELGVGAAATLAVAQIGGGTVRTYHAGDSGILVTGQRGKVKHATVHHSPVSYAVEAGVLDAEEALHHEDLNVVSNLVGSTDMRITVGPSIELAPRDTVCLASDGVFDNLHAAEVVDCIRKGGLEKAAAALLAVSNKRMTQPVEGKPSKPDDLAFVVFRLGPA